MSRAKKITERHIPKPVMLSEADANHLIELLGLPRNAEERGEILAAVTRALNGYGSRVATSTPASIKATLVPLLAYAEKLREGIKALPQARRLDLHPHEGHAIGDEELSRIVAALSDTIGRHDARIAAGRARAPLPMTTQLLQGIFEQYAGDEADWRTFLDAALTCAGIPHSDPHFHPGRILP